MPDLSVSRNHVQNTNPISATTMKGQQSGVSKERQNSRQANRRIVIAGVKPGSNEASKMGGKIDNQTIHIA